MILADPFLCFVFSWKLSLIETLDYELYADQVELFTKFVYSKFY
jgi:hypothetical protein